MMIKERIQTTEISPAVSVVPALFYFPVQFRKNVNPNSLDRNQWGIMYSWRSSDGSSHFTPHRGRFTGKPVTFSRYSDSERLCDVLNENVRNASSNL